MDAMRRIIPIVVPFTQVGKSIELPQLAGYVSLPHVVAISSLLTEKNKQMTK